MDDDYEADFSQDDEQQQQRRSGREEKVGQEMEELRAENANLREKLQTALTTGTSGMCNDLRQEFFKLLSTQSGAAVGMSIPDNVDDFTDQQGILALSNISKVLNKNGGGAARVSNTAGSRLGTAGGGELQAMAEHIQQLQDELRNALKAGEDIRLLKAKLESLVERARKDKERYLTAKSGEEFAKKKMDMLRDHLEKLMTHLKHEATAKVRTQEHLRVQERELFKVQEQKAIIQRKSNAKDRLVLELREGSKILEDQLRLMDEKYLELRVKLDWARENGDKKVKQAQAKAKELRMKLMLSGGGGSMSLEKMTLPSLGQMGSQSMFDPSQVDNGMEGASYAELGGDSLAYAGGNQTPGNNNNINNNNNNNRGHGKGGSRNGKGGSMMKSQSVAEGSIASNGPPTMDKVMEKIRRHAGGKTEWTEDQMRDLVKSR